MSRIFFYHKPPDIMERLYKALWGHAYNRSFKPNPQIMAQIQTASRERVQTQVTKQNPELYRLSYEE